MKRTHKAAAPLLALCLVCAALLGPRPQAVWAASKLECSAPVVTEAVVDPAGVTAGSPFGLKLTFTQYEQTADDKKLGNQADYAEISVACPNGNVQVNSSKYTVQLSPYEADSDSGETGGIILQYVLYIPEPILRYVGPGPGTLRFTISYFENQKDDRIARVTTQKTVIQGASGTEESTLLVDASSPIPTIRAGEDATVNIPLVSNGVTGDVQVSVSVAQQGISFTTAGSVYTLSFGSQRRATLPLRLHVDGEVPPGVYPVTLRAAGNELVAYLRVTGGGENAGSLALESFRLDRSPVQEGQNFALTLVLRNNGEDQSNVVVALPSLDTASISANGTMDRQTLEELKAGQAAEVTFSLSANASMASGNYPLEVQLSADGMEAPVSAGKVFIPVRGTAGQSGEDPDAGDSSKPQIIIQRYDYGGQSVVGGQEFLLKMDFRNTSRAYAIENLKMTIGNPASEGEGDGSAFTPANSSNTFFVERVAPGEVFSQEIALFPKADAAPKSYGVTVRYTYEAVVDGKRMADLSGEETIAIPLTQPDRFEIQDATIYGPIMLGDTAYLNIDYVNKGKSTVYNVTIALEGENFTSGEMSSYVGNVESGSSDYFEASLSALAEGMITGRAVITYEDANGIAKEVSKDFSCEVMPAYEPPIDDPGMVEPLPEETGMPQWAVYTVAGAGAAVAIASLIGVRKLQKLRRRRIEEEEESYEEAAPPGGDDA